MNYIAGDHLLSWHGGGIECLIAYLSGLFMNHNSSLHCLLISNFNYSIDCKDTPCDKHFKEMIWLTTCHPTSNNLRNIIVFTF